MTESRATWSKRVERWRASGQTAASFAAAEGVNMLSLKWWKWRLGADARLSAPRRSAPRPKAKTAALVRTAPPAAVSPLTFIEMTAVVAEPLEVVLPSEVRIRVRTGFDAPTLARVLDVLERRT